MQFNQQEHPCNLNHISGTVTGPVEMSKPDFLAYQHLTMQLLETEPDSINSTRSKWQRMGHLVIKADLTYTHPNGETMPMTLDVLNEERDIAPLPFTNWLFGEVLTPLVNAAMLPKASAEPSGDGSTAEASSPGQSD